MILNASQMLAFDDVWLQPQYSELESRATPDLSSQLSTNVIFSHPVIASNMASVVGKHMAETLDKSGSIAILHRFMSRDELVLIAKTSHMKQVAFSVGIKDEDYEIAQEMYDILGNRAIILVDIAHAHTKKMGVMLSKIKKIGFSAVIAGNIATGDGYRFLYDHGADSVRVGIAGGKVCTTKNITGHHIPTLQSVIECNDVRQNSGIPMPSIIADGGISSSGDAAKALAAGADFVCLGSVLAATSDSPSELVNNFGGTFKLHYGMSSKTAIDMFFKDKKTHVAPEGIKQLIPYTGVTSDVLQEFLSGIKASLTYTGSKNLNEFKRLAILRFKS